MLFRSHENVIRFDHRPFDSVEEMDKALIALWNRKVNSEDLVYVVGDFAYRNEKPFDWYLRQLKGKKYLIVGNHDGKLWKDSIAMSYFEGVDKMCHETMVAGTFVFVIILWQSGMECIGERIMFMGISITVQMLLFNS